MPRLPGPKRADGVSTRAPVKELGTILQGVFSPDGMAPWNMFVDEQEYVPELVWPRSVRTYEMVRTDSQVSALLKGTTLPIRRPSNWSLDPNGVEENERVTRLASMLDLPILGESQAGDTSKPRGRMKRRFIFTDHVRKALLAGIYGHYYFEQVGEIDKDGLWSLRKLAERPPRTIADFRINPNGSLISILQNVAPSPVSRQATTSGNPFGPYPEIPIDNLVGYVWDQEGANWAGRSWLRDIYKNWLLKDIEIRTDAINHQRAGGVPYIIGHPDASTSELSSMQQAASNFRVGDQSGLAVPYGAEVNVVRAANSNVVESIKYHDEAMARNFLLMVMQLGATRSGSRNLGSTFVEFFAEGINSIGNWFADYFNEYVIEDYWDWNYGEDEPFAPRLTYVSDPELDASDIMNLIRVGAIQADDELEDALRKEFGLPKRGTPRPNQVLLPTSMIDQQDPETGDGKPKLSTDEKATKKAQAKA